jgi:hypothetical protein
MLVKSFFRILVVLFSASLCCANSQADDPAGKGNQATDNKPAGAWQLLGEPYPDPQSVPGHEDGLAQTLRESFELTCTTQVSEPGELKFQVRVAESGHVDVAALNSTADTEHPAQVYMNAFLWRAHSEEYSVDRFSGVLRINPGKRLYQCQKIGGRKF